MKIVIIGADSFIAGKFIELYKEIYFIKGVSRKRTKLIEELVTLDFFSIPNDFFKEIDVVINFAAIVHRPDVKDEEIYDNINYKLAIHIASKAFNSGVKHFIQMSSVAVYGNITSIHIDSPFSPQTEYGRSKLKADLELIKMNSESFNVTIIRPPMVYGGSNAPGNMIRLIKLVNKNIPLPFKGINNQRVFINVNNLIQYLNIITNKQLSGIFLIADQQSVSTEDLIKIISRLMSKNCNFFRLPKFVLKLIHFFNPILFDKLFGSLVIQTNFPYENLINHYSIEQGLTEMLKPIKEK